MALLNVALSGATITLRGAFNPAIFQPAWYGAQGLIAKAETDVAKINVIHPQISSFQTEQYIIQVTLDIYAASTTTSPFIEALRDVVLGTFRVLTHTPVSMMGLNRHVHVRTASEAVWHSVGHKLAPKEPFWLPILKEPGTQSLTMRGRRPDKHRGYVDVKVEPSASIPHGVFIQINDHFEVEEDQGRSAVAIMDILDAEWAEADRRADTIFDRFGSLM